MSEQKEDAVYAVKHSELESLAQRAFDEGYKQGARAIVVKLSESSSYDDMKDFMREIGFEVEA